MKGVVARLVAAAMLGGFSGSSSSMSTSQPPRPVAWSSMSHRLRSPFRAPEADEVIVAGAQALVSAAIDPTSKGGARLI